jgi:hypothetical protein
MKLVTDCSSMLAMTYTDNCGVQQSVYGDSGGRKGSSRRVRLSSAVRAERIKPSYRINYQLD